MAPGDNQRYSRQILFPAIGEQGQSRIESASICIVGCGALGTYQAEALTRAGVGSIRIIDRDYVDFSNLQRQCLFSEDDAVNETPKAIAAQNRLQRINSSVHIEPFVADLTPSNAEELTVGFDVILDGTDNFETRYLLNDISVKHQVPWIYGAAIGSYGIFMPVLPAVGPCLTCIYPEPPAGIQPTCDVNGVIAAAPASIGALQSAAALRILTGWSDFAPFLQTIDVWTGEVRRIKGLARDAGCPTCAERRFIYLEGQRKAPVSLCGRNAVQLHESARPVDLKELAARLTPLGDVRVNDFALRMEWQEHQITVFPDGRAIVKGTTDVGLARSLYSRLIGN